MRMRINFNLWQTHREINNAGMGIMNQCPVTVPIALVPAPRH